MRDFDPYGYDERQYCSPGFDLPVGRADPHAARRVPRVPHLGGQPRPRSTPSALAEAAGDRHVESSTILEGNGRYVNLSPKGEPQLGRRGLYESLGGGTERARARAGDAVGAELLRRATQPAGRGPAFRPAIRARSAPPQTPSPSTSSWRTRSCSSHSSQARSPSTWPSTTGGYFAGATALASLVVITALALRVILDDQPFAGLSRPVAAAAGALMLFAVWVLSERRVVRFLRPRLDRLQPRAALPVGAGAVRHRRRIPRSGCGGCCGVSRRRSP